MKIVFLGTGEFAVPSLRALHHAGHEIALVVSQPDRPQGRGLTLKPTPVKAVAGELGLEVFQPEKLRHEPDRVIGAGAEVLIVVAYGQLLRENVLTCAPLGAINVHASLLPRYRGAAPIQWALAEGESQTGVTTMQLDRGMDTGPILLQRAFPIEPDATAALLQPRLADLGAVLLIETLNGLLDGSVRPTPQDESRASSAPLLRKSDSVIDFTRPAHEIANRLRGFSPWPGIQFSHAGRSIKILAAAALSPGSAGGAVPGEVIGLSREGLDVACAGGSILRLTRVQPESRGAMSAFDFANGNQVGIGARLAPTVAEVQAGESRRED